MFPFPWKPWIPHIKISGQPTGGVTATCNKYLVNNLITIVVNYVNEADSIHFNALMSSLVSSQGRLNFQKLAIFE